MKKEFLTLIFLLSHTLIMQASEKEPEVTLRIIALAAQEAEKNQDQAAYALFRIAITSAQEEKCPLLAASAHLWLGFLRIRSQSCPTYNPIAQENVLEHLHEAQRLAPRNKDIIQQSERLKSVAEKIYRKNE